MNSIANGVCENDMERACAIILVCVEFYYTEY